MEGAQAASPHRLLQKEALPVLGGPRSSPGETLSGSRADVAPSAFYDTPP